MHAEFHASVKDEENDPGDMYVSISKSLELPNIKQLVRMRTFHFRLVHLNIFDSMPILYLFFVKMRIFEESFVKSEQSSEHSRISIKKNVKNAKKQVTSSTGELLKSFWSCF